MADIQKDYDIMFMQRAVSLAKKGGGRTSINPLVGAVITKNNRIVGTGFHRRRGEAHAEVVALTDAGARAKNATLYVNLEPCCSTGHTPPCVHAICRAGIKRVVIGMIDPNPAVNGKGMEFLKKNNIKVTTNVLSAAAEEINRIYKKFITTKTPYVILKIAVSEDGKLSGYKGKYITSEPSRRWVHSLRSRVGAVLVGINTVLADDPLLTDRLVGRNNPARVVIDPHLRIPLNANFLKPGVKRFIITDSGNEPDKIKRLTEAGVNFIYLEGKEYSLKTILKRLTEAGINSILVEGGGKIFAQFFNEALYDEIFLFMAPHRIEKGLSISENLLQYVLSNYRKKEKSGEDLLYHVYRHN
ncbi:MAG TPA: bifunctional diaminohydroxyphosphoribosylaminopyrimidine deaminase/5-amino-6-(5-phosphoribosylamino)uracil reductase RibD [candidate division WOR-3 bacterium]|uniref:Riboflavin biosynthesis protein RibD n=1 Tax=candidate division WOR-3 bacterium TaxID=2052148 RepID=A0A9C9JZA9_UNCW3|nr:bifunctional diaminohydroxyphosphoribosylaminopyrimidine deaminase/5-amino-6-(5-phosphoribosylamino)uracil reductase RibD [candidate division WOR-3 bacterium]